MIAFQLNGNFYRFINNQWIFTQAPYNTPEVGILRCISMRGTIFSQNFEVIYDFRSIFKYIIYGTQGDLDTSNPQPYCPLPNSVRFKEAGILSFQSSPKLKVPIEVPMPLEYGLSSNLSFSSYTYGTIWDTYLVKEKESPTLTSFLFFCPIIKFETQITLHYDAQSVIEYKVKGGENE